MYALNTATKDSIKNTPFRLMYARDPKLFIDLELPHIYSETRRKQLKLAPKMRYEARLAILKAQAKYTKQYNKGRMEVEYKVGDLVLLFTPAAPVGENYKLWRKWSGPFEVIKVTSSNNVMIRKLGTEEEGKIVHVSRVKAFHKVYETSSSSESTKEEESDDTKTVNEEKSASEKESQSENVSNKVIIDSSSSDRQLTEEDREEEESTIVINPEDTIEIQPQTTRSGRQINPPARLDDYVVRRE